MIRAWLFDLDGTLTVAQHDFAWIKRHLGLPVDRPVLEGIAERPLEERGALLDAVHAWEVGLADRAEPAPGAAELLAAIRDAGCPRGVVTRNSRATALRTLASAGLAGFFAADDVVGRDEAPPKPAPDGIRLLLARFGVPPAEAAMVGDFRFDLDAARPAGVRAIWVDVEGSGLFTDLADLVVQDLRALRPLG